MESKQRREIYEFGIYRLDLRSHRLLKDGEVIPLTSKEFEVLLILIERAGEVVRKTELMDRVWADAFVEEGTLTRNISWLRKKLGGKGEQIIETLPRLGYRFVPQVRKIDQTTVFINDERTDQTIPVEETAYAEAPNTPTDPLSLSKSKRTKYLRWSVIGALIVAGASILAFVYLRSSGPKTITLSKPVPFSGVPGLEDMPSFSADGKQITFVWDGDQGNFDVYTKLIGTGEPLRLTRAPENDYFPAFSPDGKSIAFIRNYLDRSEVFLIPALGGAERKICELNSVSSSLSFSPDGQTLSVIDSDAGGTRFGIFLVDIQTGNKRRLTTPPEFAADYETSFSPDGKKLAFLRVFNKQIIELFVMSADGGEPQQLTRDMSVITGLAWGKEGRSIIFTSRRNVNQLNLWQIPSTGGEPVRIVTGEKNVTNPAVSADGSNLAFVEELRDTNLWKLDYNGPGIKESRLVVSSRAEHSPSFSPSGNKLAFVSDRTGASEIWISDADGKNQRQLTEIGKSAGSPRFSPDGRLIVFDVQDGDWSDIFTIPADGGEPTRVVSFGARAILPSWSANGQFIYFTSNKSGSYQLWKTRANGGDPIQLTNQGAFESFASPDGKLIFFTKARGEMGIWKITPEGSGESAVSGLEDAGFWRYWSVCNEGIHFLAYAANPPYQVKLYDFGSGKTSEVMSTQKTPIKLFSGFAVSAKDKTIIFAQSDLNRSTILLAQFEN